MRRKIVAEILHEGAALSFAADEMLHEVKTAHQHLQLIRNSIFGKVLLLDGVVQVTSADEFMYHEMLAHVPITAHADPADVLIIGGGDCGLAEEALKHERVRTLTQVEIDPSVLDFSREHFTEFNAPVFDDPRFKVEIADGAKFAAETDKRFDVVLVDSTDPIGPGAALFTPEFYGNLKRILRDGGIVATQNGVPFLQECEFKRGISALTSVFPIARCYLVAVPTYFGGHMTLGWASESEDALNVSEEILKERAARIETRYYTPAHHHAAFVLPRYIEDLLAEAQKQGKAG